MKNENSKIIWTAVIVAIIVALISSFVTMQMTGNTIKVATSRLGTEVYTKAEVDAKLNYSIPKSKPDISFKEIFSNSRSVYYGNGPAGYPNVSITCYEICQRESSGETCLLGSYTQIIKDNRDSINYVSYKDELVSCNDSRIVSRSITERYTIENSLKCLCTPLI